MSFVLAPNYNTSLRAFLLGKVALPSVLLYRNLFKRHKTPWNENVCTLKYYPVDSIGNELAHFLSSHSFDLEPKMENHDFFHVVLGYGASLPEEAALHFFLIGNGKRSHYPFIAAGVGFMFFTEFYDLYIDAYHRGRHSKPFVKKHLKKHLNTPLETFKKMFEIPERLV